MKNIHLTFCTALLASFLGSSIAHAQGANLRIAAAGNDLGTLDPHRATATPDIGVVSMIFNGLVRITPPAGLLELDAELAAAATEVAP